MKIVMVHPHDVYSHPWMIRPIKIAEELIRRGHAVSLCFIPEHKRRCGFGIIHKNLPPQLKLFPLKWARRGVLANAKIIEEAAKDADIIHIQKADSSTALPGLIAAWRLNKPVHYDWDDWETEILKEMHYTGPKVFDLYWYEKKMPRFVDTLSVSSRALRELAIRYGMPEERIVPAPVGADLEYFNPKNSGISTKEKHNVKGPLVIYTGQLDGANYLELLIRAIPLVNESIPETSFLIVGDGESLKEHKKLATGLDIKNITYTGYIPHDEVPAYLAAADVAVACFADTPVSRCKSPLKIVEYLASGKAIVASRVGEVISMVEDCGRMVKPGDSKELAEQIV